VKTRIISGFLLSCFSGSGPGPAISCLVLLCFLLPASAQEPTLYNYGVEEGLPSSECYYVMQDSKGFIWICTDRGVARFDGYSFRTFTVRDGLTYNVAFGAHEDPSGRIWFITMNNRPCFFYEDSIYAYPHNDVLNSGPRFLRIFSLYSDGWGNTVFGTLRGGVITIDAAGKSAQWSPAKGDTLYHYFAWEDNGRLILGSKDNTLRSSGFVNADFSFFRNGRRVLTWKMPWNYGLYKDQVIGMLRKDGTAIVRIRGIVLEVNSDSLRQADTSLTDAESFMESKDSSLWVALPKGGIRRYAPGDELSSTDYQTYLADEIVTSSCEDREGGIWLSTLSSGLFYMPAKEFTTYVSGENRNNDIAAITSDGGSGIYAMYPGGLLKHIRKNRSEVALRVPSVLKSKLEMLEGIHYDPETSRLWVTGIESYVFHLPSGKKIGQLLPLKHFLAHPGHDHLWGLFWRGAKRIHISSMQEVPPVIYFPVRMHSAYIDKKGNFWAGGTDGLYILADTKFVKAGGDIPLLNKRISSIAELDDGTLVLSVQGYGIALWKGGNDILPIDARHGLPSEMVNAVTIHRNTIWAATNKGVFHISREAGRPVLRVYNTNNGLPVDEIRNILVTDHNVWLGTKRGVIHFDPGAVKKNLSGPPIYIEKIYSDRRPDIRPGNGEIVLQPSEQMLAIHYAGLSYRMRGKVVYRYKLEGSDPYWSTTTETSIVLRSVHPGRYRLIIYAENEDGVLSGHPLVISIRVLAPFTSTVWFTILIISGITIVLTGFFLLQIRQIKRRIHAERMSAEYRQKSLFMQINPHFIFNILNAIQTFILQENKEGALKYLSRFARLMRSNLEHAGSEYIPLKDEVTAITQYLELEMLRFDNRFGYSINISASVPADEIAVPPMLIQPFVENAIRHGLLPGAGPDRGVTVSFEMQTSYLLCRVEDNGIGRTAAREAAGNTTDRRSFGIDITVKRLRMICRDVGVPFRFEIIDKDENGKKGTIVLFHLPYRRLQDIPQG